MPGHDVIVVGASSGGVAALTRLLGGLPGDFAASVFIVLHVPPDATSQLPTILNRAGRLPVAHAADGEPIRRGRVYVAPPGSQMYVHRGKVSVKRGPVENLYRPAIDPLFRTAAHHYGRRVVGVVLSGALDDGAAGLLAVKQAGGVAIVQDPAEAAVAAMPRAAQEAAHPDYCLPADEIGPVLASLVNDVNGEAPNGLGVEVPLETVEEAPAPSDAVGSQGVGELSAFTCPDCSGTLWEIRNGDVIRYRCRVGHAYSSATMLHAQGESVERALWIALRSLEEREALLNRLARHASDRGHVAVARMFLQRVKEVNVDVKAIHLLLTSAPSLEPVEAAPGEPN